MKRIWKVKTRVVFIVSGALGTVLTRLKSFMADLGIKMSFGFETIQKASLVGKYSAKGHGFERKGV